VVASATELIIAFVMGAWGSVQWGLSGLIDIRLSLLLLATSLIGVQLGVARWNKCWQRVKPQATSINWSRLMARTGLNERPHPCWERMEKLNL